MNLAYLQTKISGVFLGFWISKICIFLVMVTTAVFLGLLDNAVFLSVLYFQQYFWVQFYSPVTPVNTVLHDYHIVLYFY